MKSLKVVTFDSTALVPASYDPLFAHSAARSPFLSREWFVNFEQTVLGVAARPLLFGVETPERPLALLPTWPSTARGLLSKRCIQALGNYYTSLFDLVGAGESTDSAALAAMSDALCHADGGWDYLDLRPLDQGVPRDLR